MEILLLKASEHIPANVRIQINATRTIMGS